MNPSFSTTVKGRFDFERNMRYFHRIFFFLQEVFRKSKWCRNRFYAFQLIVAGAEKTCNNRKHVVHVFEIEFRDISCLQRQAIYLCDIVRQLDHFRINRVYTFSYNTFAIVSLYTAVYRCSFLSRNSLLLLFALILLQLPNRKAFFFISS